MSTPIPQPVAAYINRVENGENPACREQHALCAYLRRIFETEDLDFREELFTRYVGLARYFPFQALLPWEALLLALWFCTYTAAGLPRWKTVFDLTGRGSGKDGFLGFVCFCAVSPYNPAKYYDVDLVGNDEVQAMRPVKDVVAVLRDPAHKKKMARFYKCTKEQFSGLANHGTVTGWSNAPANRDGLRSGLVIFNEVHQYVNYDNIRIFVSGQGKVADPRRGIFTSNGYVNDGPLDDYLARSLRILFEGEADRGFLPFICRLDSEDEVNDEANWHKANPSLAFFPHLLQEIRDEYDDWLMHPEENGDLITKRMGIRKGLMEISVTEYENVVATKRPLPDLRGWSCVAGVDYAEINDWCSVDLHFKRGEERFDISHSWVSRKSRTLHLIKPPWQDWAQQGHLTVVDDVIEPRLIADYIREAGRTYNIRKLAMDHYRWTLLADAMRQAGWDASDRERVLLVRLSQIMQNEPVIRDCFDRQLFTWGDCPPLRWATNNTKRIRAGKKQGTDIGNFYYGKIEAKSRKTDPFMALVAAMCAESALGTGAPVRKPMAAVVIR